MLLALKILAAFLIGAIPFAKVAMLGTGVDITKVGSKNPGFRNVTPRCQLVARCDLSDRGSGQRLLCAVGARPSADSIVACWAMGIAAVMGHCWSPFLGFNGGKGVATTFGVLLRLHPVITLICLPLYPLLRFVGGKLKLKQEVRSPRSQRRRQFPGSFLSVKVWKACWQVSC
jgi:glycerol-3-phosphate acyltransferase PlsY